MIACNEADVLERCLDSVKWAEDLVVIVDAKSHDATEEIARRRGARVEVRPYEGDIEQKSFAVSRARHEWVLVIDPDEVMPAETAREIQELLERGGDGCAGFEVNRVTWHLGRWIRHGEFYPDWVLRLFQRSRSRYGGMNPHGRVEVDGTVARLSGHLEHYSYRDLADQMSRIQHFSGQKALALARAGRRVRRSDLVLRPAWRFVRAFLLRGGFRDGSVGFILAAASSFHVFLSYAKLWEMQRVQGAAAQRGEAERSSIRTAERRS
jgi:glycosyltransferase involved in cell wall biosynthesis